MTTHVFIVDKNSFPVHLEYMFAGTGFVEKKDGKVEKEEQMGLLADISRVRTGDKVIFYLQKDTKKDIEGSFFGIFKIKKHEPLVFKEKDGSYLRDKLQMKLIYRTLIEPDEVYSKPVTEWEALDDFPDKSNDIIWSLIYRKLKGARGCTPLTLEESERLINLIKSKNVGKLNFEKDFTYKNGEIVHEDSIQKKYEGELPEVNIIPQIVDRACRRFPLAFESELQVFFTQKAGKDPIKEITGEEKEILWLGNEVYCSFGMQKIDVFTIIIKKNDKEFRVIELKDEKINEDITKQIKKYIRWVEKYILGAENKNIQPFIVAVKIPEKGTRIRNKKYKEDGTVTPFFKQIIDTFKKFNKEQICLSLRYFEYTIKDDKIIFEEVNYNRLY